MYARYAHRQPYASFRSTGPPLVYLRPDIDANNSGWTDQANGTTNLYQVVDEATANDADYVRSSENPTSDIIRFRLSDPAKNLIEPFRLRYRCGVTMNTSLLGLTTRLKQGTTQIASWSDELSNNFITVERTLTSGQFAAITDFNDLFIEFEARPNILFNGALLHLDGSNGSTSIVDSSGNNHAFAVNGAAVLDTSQAKFGVSSLSTVSSAFSGAGSLSFGTGDYTVDFWFKENGAPTGQINILIFGNSPTNDTIVYIPLADTIRIYNRNSGTNVITGTTAPSPNTWHHVALTRASTVTKLFLNGVQEGSNWVDTKNYADGSTEPAFGNGLIGWIDEVRIIRGTAMWTGNFTPPTAPY